MKDLLTDELSLRDVQVSQSARAARAGAGLDTVLEVGGQRLTVRQLAQLKQQAAVTPAAAGRPAVSAAEDKNRSTAPSNLGLSMSNSRNYVCSKCEEGFALISSYKKHLISKCVNRIATSKSSAMSPLPSKSVLDAREQVKPTKPITKKVSPLKIGHLKNYPKKVHYSPKVVFQDQNREEYESTPKSNSKKVVQPAASKPESKDEQFHGFEDSEIPAWVMDNFESYDLKTGFNIKPTVFVSISSKKTQKQVKENIEIPTVLETTTAAPIPKLIILDHGLEVRRKEEEEQERH